MIDELIHIHLTDFQKELFIVDDLHQVFESDSLTSSHPIFVPVKNPSQIREIFDTISYAKVSDILMRDVLMFIQYSVCKTHIGEMFITSQPLFTTMHCLYRLALNIV